MVLIISFIQFRLYINKHAKNKEFKQLIIFLFEKSIKTQMKYDVIENKLIKK